MKVLSSAALAALLAAATAAPAQQVVTGLTSSGALYNFSPATPGTGTAVPVVGLTVGDSLVAIDYRPVDLQLVGVGYNSATGTARVYSINPTTGVATSINANTISLGTGLSRVMADFNPTANALRVTTSAATGNNLRIPGAGTGALVQDTDLNPANAGIRATAYSRNTPGGGTSGATTLYLIDGTNNQLVSQGSIDFFTGSGTSPNTGTLTTVATLSGVTGSSVVGFDIYNAAGTSASSQGTAYLSTGTSFYSFNLNTGAAAVLGSYTGVTLIDFAAVPEPGTTALALAGLAGVYAQVRRRRARAAEATA